MMKRLKSVCANLLLMAIVALIALLIAEAAVRYLYKDQVVMYPRYQTAASYGDFTIRKLRPNSVFWHTSIDGRWRFETNSKGFRNDREFSYDKPTGMIRVLSLGDSHTEGFEVRQENTFSSVIQQQLDKAGVAAEVINTGVSGFSNAEELVLLENEGIKYHPDYVVLAFFGNDFQDNINAGIFDLDNSGQLMVQKHSYIPGVKIQDFIYAIPGVQWLSENSYFYSILFNNTWAFFKHSMAKEQGVELAIPDRGSRPTAHEMALAYKILKRAYTFCHSQGIKLILVDVPYALNGYNKFSSSFPDEWKGMMEAVSDTVIYSSMFADNAGQLVHVPHGHRHISEFTHGQIGYAVSHIILDSKQ